MRTRERARFGSIVVESILRVDLNPLVESRRIQFLADARQIGFLSLNHFCFICYFVLKIKTNLFKIYFSIVHFAQFDAQYRPVGSSESSFFICKIILTKLQFFPIYVQEKIAKALYVVELLFSVETCGVKGVLSRRIHLGNFCILFS